MSTLNAMDQLDRRRALVRLGCALMMAVAGGAAVYAAVFSPQQFAAVAYWPLRWTAGYVVFVVAYVLIERAPERALTPGKVGLLAAQALAALYLVWLFPTFLVTSLVVVVAWQIAWATSLRNALLATLGLALALVTMKCAVQNGGMTLLILLASCAFQLFAVAAAHLARSEAEARDGLARANAELNATHALLTESARMSERLRISRDLHDVLGHNLTTLAIHLDVASRLTRGRAAEHLTHARDAAGVLLEEVRAVVSQVRVQPVDLRATLLALTEGLGGLQVELHIPDDLGALDPARADAVLRCVQEVITNTLRHAGAKRLVIDLQQGLDGALTIAARDDGRGGPVVEGHGLTGMRERFEALGGSLSIASQAGEGLRVLGAIPALGPAQ